MDSITQRLMMGAAGSGGAKTYVEDVFSTYLYTGNDSTETITNGIDLAGKGGLVWIKCRGVSTGTFTLNHTLCDTARGTRKHLRSNTTDSESASTTIGVSAYNSDGFSLDGSNVVDNSSLGTYASWTFRKAAKFFDVVTYTGTGSTRTVAHNLGSVPGCIVIKRTDTAQDWVVYHRGVGNTAALTLNTTAAAFTSAAYFNNTDPTSTEFTVATGATLNASGGTYVAYLFAHDAGGFGDSGNDSVVKCGSYAGTGAAQSIDLGWEPQWLLFKRATGGTADWQIFDNMRGWGVSQGNTLSPNLSAAENSNPFIDITSTGFRVTATGTNWNASGSNYIYIAIRRGPMKTPTDATKVFALSTAAANTSIATSFAVDLDFMKRKDAATQWWFISRLTGSTRVLDSSSTGAEATIASATYFDRSGSFLQNDIINPIIYLLSRAPGFMDVVTYTGTGTYGTVVSHGLGVAPELIILKSRSATSTRWPVYQKSYASSGFAPENGVLFLNTSDAWASSGFAWANTAPTTTAFTVGFTNEANASSVTYIAYLFASCPGVSKVGSYTGTGTTLSVDCGFTNGARFVLIKRTDSTGDWYVWDTARGIVSGNDSYLLLNSTAAEVTNTDYIDPLNSGFEISSTAPAAINANGGTYIYLAIA